MIFVMFFKFCWAAFKAVLLDTPALEAVRFSMFFKAFIHFISIVKFIISIKCSSYALTFLIF